ncbi:hypothetical protein HDU93_006589 [Gonapodya sp. JEL0774]|nr:hypothetical protein HDU93_006589 [Gonapodya sp. JEL0774]
MAIRGYDFSASLEEVSRLQNHVPRGLVSTYAELGTDVFQKLHPLHPARATAPVIVLGSEPGDLPSLVSPPRKKSPPALSVLVRQALALKRGLRQSFGSTHASSSTAGVDSSPLYDFDTLLQHAVTKSIAGKKAASTMYIYCNRLVNMEALRGVIGVQVPLIGDEGFDREVQSMMLVSMTVNCSRKYLEAHTGIPTNTPELSNGVPNTRNVPAGIPTRGLSLSIAKQERWAVSWLYEMLGGTKTWDATKKTGNPAYSPEVKGLISRLTKEYQADGGMERHAPIIGIHDIIQFYGYCVEGERAGRPILHSMYYTIILLSIFTASRASAIMSIKRSNLTFGPPYPGTDIPSYIIIGFGSDKTEVGYYEKIVHFNLGVLPELCPSTQFTQFLALTRNCNSPWVFPSYTRASTSDKLNPEKHSSKKVFKDAMVKMANVVNGVPDPFTRRTVKVVSLEAGSEGMADEDVVGGLEIEEEYTPDEGINQFPDDLDTEEDLTVDGAADVEEEDPDDEVLGSVSGVNFRMHSCRRTGIVLAERARMEGVANFTSADIMNKLSRHRTTTNFYLYIKDAGDLRTAAVRMYGFDPAAYVYSWDSVDPDFGGQAAFIPETAAKRARQALTTRGYGI